MDKDSLRKFYFSGATNFSAFSSKGKGKADGSSLSLSNVDVAVDSSITQDRSAAMADPVSVRVGSTEHEIPKRGTNSSIGRVVDQSQAAGGSAGHISAIRSIAQQNQLKNIGKPNDVQRSVKSAHNPPPDAASAEYFAFLRQQQEVHRHHSRIVEALAALSESRRDQSADVTKLRAACATLLKDIEENSDWQLRSKYDVQQLIRDACLALQPTELAPDVSSDTTALGAVSQGLEQLKQAHNGKIQYAPFKVTVDQALRRLCLLQGSLKDGNVDFTPLARAMDTFIVQLQSNCELPPLEGLIKDAEAKIDDCSARIEDMRAKRTAATADGEVHVTEQLCYGIIGEYEQLAAEVIAKAKRLDGAHDDVVVMEEVRTGYHKPIPDFFASVRAQQSKLRNRCEEDLKKMFALREKVEEVEAATSAKVARDIDQSEKVLAANTERVMGVFHRMMELEKELEELEKERNREMQRRLTEKDKDEHRKAEYAKFIATVEGHTIPLERTIKNSDLTRHGADMIEELLGSGFGVLATDLKERGKLLREIRTEAHREHVEVFRSLLTEIGDITYRKERMIEEVDKKIQQAHIQQELLAETFNPNARKFGEIKKNLLTSRDELEEDVEALKKRAEAALAAFRYTEMALNEANIEFVHPVTEQEHHALAMKARMIEYKAMVAGHNRGTSALMDEIEGLQRDVTDTRRDIDAVNASTTGTISRSIPMIRAANNTRLGMQ